MCAMGNRLTEILKKLLLFDITPSIFFVLFVLVLWFKGDSKNLVICLSSLRFHP